MKKHAICIQCHAKPEMVNFIIRSLPQEHFDFYIHVDKKSNMFEEITRAENVFFAERKDVRWGRFSQVEATLSMLSMIDCKKYGYIHLISGNDFFVKSPQEILDFFEYTDLEYIQSNPLDEKCTWSWHGEDRYACWHPQWMIRRPTEKFFKCIRVAYREFIMRTKIFKRKKFPVSQFFGGSQWFSVTGSCMQWIMEYLTVDERNGGGYINFFRHGVCIDEIFFSTLVRYSPFAEKIANEHLRFMKWEGATMGGPKTLTEEDFQTMKESDCIFARKFDSIETISALRTYLEENKIY